MPKSNYNLSTLSRALDVLELIEKSPSPLSLTEIAAELKEPTPIIYRVLWTLEGRGYLYRRPYDKRYQHTSRTMGPVAVKRAIAILRSLADLAPAGGSTAELSARLGTSEKMVDELLRPLLDENIIERTHGTNRWHLSFSLLELVRAMFSSDNLFATVRPLMELLHARTGETVSLFHLSGKRQVVTAVVPSKHPVRYVLDIGTAYPLYLGAGGKAALAMMPAKFLKSVLEEDELIHLTGHVPDKIALKAELKQIQKRGYAISFGERVEGASAVAAPIRDVGGNLRAVIGIMMPAFRITHEKIAVMGDMLVREVGELHIPPMNDMNAD